MAERRREEPSSQPSGRKAPHRLVDELPEAELAEARLYLDYLRSGRDPLLRTLLDAPPDDEPQDDEERASIAEALEGVKAGHLVGDEEIKRELDV